MLPDFEKALYGIQAGDKKTFKVKFPKDYQAEELQGKKVDFSITTHRVEEQVLPPVDDELAKLFEVSDGGLERFLQDVKENMRREADAKINADVREQVIDALIEANKIDIPQTLKHQEMHAIQREAMQRMGIEDVEQAPPLENLAELAEKRVRLGLLIRQLIVDQGLTVDEQKVRARVEDMCAGYENAADMVSMYMTNPQIVQQVEPMVLEQQAIDWLMDNGKITAKKVAFAEFMDT
jgi:trigger factor